MKNTNVFAALDSLRKKKKSDKERNASEVIWTPAPLNSKSWADVDDDDDDYYATTAPPLPVWASSSPTNHASNSHIQDTESEEDILDEGDIDDDLEEEHDHGAEPEDPEPDVKKAPEVFAAAKETERQLSKKERKKKELAELDALLADFGVTPKDNDGQDESSSGAAAKDKDSVTNGDGEKNPGTESKSAKKKKKKSSKEVKESQDEPNKSEIGNGSEEAVEAEEDTSVVDVKERLKKMASMKKKKSSKEMDGAAKAASQEAAARSAKLAAAKKKEKGHYNQQPVR